MKIDNILNYIEDNKSALCKAYVVAVIIAVGVLGYGLGVSNQASLTARTAIESSPSRAQKVLGDRIAPFYVNPFNEIEAKEVKFPVAQLRGCRNWEECRTLCSKPANFQECVAWSNTQ